MYKNKYHQMRYSNRIRSKNLELFALLLSFQIFQCCMEKTEIDIPSLLNEKKIVVYGVISPGEEIQVFVARTFPACSDRIEQIEDSIYLFDARVLLYNKDWTDSIYLQLTNDTIPYYSCAGNELQLVEGETYELFVRADGYTPVSASTTIPQKAAMWENDWELVVVSDEIDGDYFDAYVFKGTWKTPVSDGYQFVSTNFLTEDHFINRSYSFEYSLSNKNVMYESEPTPLWTDWIHIVTLVTADENFYKYAEYYTFYNDLTEDVHYNGDGIYIDLFRGIMPEYTNIEGGYGVFGSYLEDSLVVYDSNNE